MGTSTRSAGSAGYFRQPFTAAERELDSWFREQAQARGLEVEEVSDALEHRSYVALWRALSARPAG